MRCGIALGSNIADRRAHLRAARAAVEQLHHGPEPLLASSLYEAEPVGCAPGTEPFLNAVVEIEHPGPPLALLHALRAIEESLGRPSQRPRNAPRTIDLDLLYAGDCVMTGEELTLPHPRLGERRFVLAPLAEIRPQLRLPGTTEPVEAQLATLPDQPWVARASGSWDDGDHA
jgi:2-amino-4-hydroxy-6-hydroxymethyldihydropteridine diphosphokinase